MMQEIKILHMYHDLMNLYGDWANTAVLSHALTEHGYSATVEEKSIGDEFDLSAYDYIYIGSGTERNQRACMQDLAQYKEALLERIEAGMYMLATGNSHELFGRSVTDSDGGRFEALGLLDFETVRGSSRTTGDCVCRASFLKEKLIGFINRADKGQAGNIARPFTNDLGPGANDSTNTEGIMYKNLLGTYLTGPILVRNPPLLWHYVSLLDKHGDKQGNGSSVCLRHAGHTDEPSPCSTPFFTYQNTAYQMALKELTERIGNK